MESGKSMRKVIVTNNVSLDGVMQAPGRFDEDTRGGFERGGWALPYNDVVMGLAPPNGQPLHRRSGQHPEAEAGPTSGFPRAAA